MDKTSWAEPWHRAFQSLMPFRVREMLLVSSAYDAFVLEEDGSLIDRLFYEYSELSLSWAPRLTHADSMARALHLLELRRFDLVITVVRLGGTDVTELSQAIRARHPEIPVVLLIFDEAELGHFPGGRVPEAIDRVFQWTGSAGLLIATIKSLEDHKNVAHDTSAGGVQVILVVEDSVRGYSSFLGMLYPELMTQSASLIAEGLNDFHRLMRMRARPKILLANDFEEGLALFRRYRDNVCALMTDVRIPRAGHSHPLGGVELARVIGDEHPDLPILFQSAERDGEAPAYNLGAWFVDKNAPDFHGRVRHFLQEALGFGDFVFRLPDRTEVARARDVYEMESVLATVPGESVAYHASKNHFSTWLRARCLFQLAEWVRPRTLADFDSIEGLREHLVALLHEARLREQEGIITDLAARTMGPENRFLRVGRGSIGGKGRGLAFVNTLIVRHGLLERFEDLEIRIPKTAVLGTDAFDAFMAQLDVNELLALHSDDRVTDAVQAGNFPEEVLRNLSTAFDNLKGPLAVRSSSLLEDSRFQPFAGVYATYMLPNRDPGRDVRFQELLRAIKAVYASAFWKDARTYLAGTPHDADDQKMAVVVQQVVGRSWGRRFYPPVSGVAQSYNFYPVGGQRAEDGVVHLALGLGHTVVGGGVALRFSPSAPTVLPQFATASAFFRGSQRSFCALDLEATNGRGAHPESTLIQCGLEEAEADGVLPLVASVYCGGDDVIRENLSLPGPRMVSFNNILKWNSVPLAEALRLLLSLFRDAVGEEVEMELALDLPMSSDGPASTVRDTRPPARERSARLYVLQLRPMSAPDQRALPRDLGSYTDEAVLCRTDVALGHGTFEGIRDIVYVHRSALDPLVGRALIAELATLNERLRGDQRPYLLIGPGRWGSSDPSLGLGCAWSHINGARVIVETPIGERRVEPSQGTHFFRNITAARVGYLTIVDTATSWLDRSWLEEQSAARGGELAEGLHHIALVDPLIVRIDGRRGHAIIVRQR